MIIGGNWEFPIPGSAKEPNWDWSLQIVVKLRFSILSPRQTYIWSKPHRTFLVWKPGRPEVGTLPPGRWFCPRPSRATLYQISVFRYTLPAWKGFIDGKMLFYLYWNIIFRLSYLYLICGRLGPKINLLTVQCRALLDEKKVTNKCNFHVFI